MKKIDILLAGVGGQGVILASNILAEVAMDFGYDVKKSDVLGMAQRGGAVVSHVRLADKVRSPLVQEGKVDVLLSFEMLEAGRWAEYFGQGEYAFVSDHCVLPLSVSSGYESYPTREQIQEILSAGANQLYFVDVVELAENMGNRNVANTIMLGVLSYVLPIDSETWERGIAGRVPSKFRDLNLDAFRKGRTEAERMVGNKVGRFV